jgi:hypothetical protein
MKTALTLALLLATLVVGGAVAQNNLLSAYGGGGNGRLLSGYGGGGSTGDYRSSLSRYGGRGSSYGDVGNGYTGAYAPTYSHFHGGGGRPHSGFTGHFTGRFNAQWNGLGWNNALGQERRAWARAANTPPCGNFSRAAASCRHTTMAWDPTLSSQRGW